MPTIYGNSTIYGRHFHFEYYIIKPQVLGGDFYGHKRRYGNNRCKNGAVKQI